MSASVLALAEIQKLRYDVYCLERHFEDAARFPDHRERDEYDAHAIHVAAIEGRQQNVVATARLVLDSPLGFPLEEYANELFPRFWSLPRDKTAEISRLAVGKSFRRLEPRTSDYPLLFGLFLEMYKASTEAGLEHLLAVMEKRLWRLLRRFGLVFQQIGEPIEHRGERIPYVADVHILGAQCERLVSDMSARAETRDAVFEYAAIAA